MNWNDLYQEQLCEIFHGTGTEREGSNHDQFKLQSKIRSLAFNLPCNESPS